MRKLRVNTKSTSCDELVRIAKKCGFVIKQSKKHCKVETQDGRFVSMIPRHNSLKRETAKGVILTFNIFGAGVDFI